MAEERTWEISDLDGGNRRTVTLAQYRAEIEARKAEGKRAWEEYAAESVPHSGAA